VRILGLWGAISLLKGNWTLIIHWRSPLLVSSYLIIDGGFLQRSVPHHAYASWIFTASTSWSVDNRVVWQRSRASIPSLEVGGQPQTLLIFCSYKISVAIELCSYLLGFLVLLPSLSSLFPLPLLYLSFKFINHMALSSGPHWLIHVAELVELKLKSCCGPDFVPLPLSLSLPSFCGLIRPCHLGLITSSWETFYTWRKSLITFIF
jgi:hypothetical protein